MPFMSWFRHAVAIEATSFHAGPKPIRTPTPMRLSQDSAVNISITPMVLAEAEGSLFKSQLPTSHKIVAVGQYSIFGVHYYRSYLSNGDGAYVHFAVVNKEIAETRLYRPYHPEIEPADQEEMAFWLDKDEGFIGNPIMPSLDADGKIPFQRSWSPSDRHIDPFTPVESIVDAAGSTTTMRHRMMHYTRSLADQKTFEHLLVSAVEADDGVAINVWLGIDVTPGELTVYPSADAPMFQL